MYCKGNAALVDVALNSTLHKRKGGCNPTQISVLRIESTRGLGVVRFAFLDLTGPISLKGSSSVFFKHHRYGRHKEAFCNVLILKMLLEVFVNLRPARWVFSL